MLAILLSPDFLESVVLLVASAWLFHLYRRVRTVGLSLAGIYLLFPAIAILMQAVGASPIPVEFSKWAALSVDVALTLALVNTTWSAESSTSQLLVEFEKLRQEVERMRADSVAREVCVERQAVHLESAADLDSPNFYRVRQLLGEVSSG